MNAAAPTSTDRCTHHGTFRLGEDELLARFANGDLSVREVLAERYMPMARRLASRHRHSSEPREDLDQVAFVGLLKAIDRYDPDRGPFVSFAVPSIRGELKRHFRDKGWGVRVTRAMQERWLRVHQATEDLYAKTGRAPTPRDVAGFTGLTVDEVLETLVASSAYSPHALDAPVGVDDTGGLTLADSLGQEDRGFEMVDLAQTIAPAVRGLPERERQILRMRIVEDLTQSEIATRMGISQMHVSRLLRRSMARLAAAAAA